MCQLSPELLALLEANRRRCPPPLKDEPATADGISLRLWRLIDEVQRQQDESVPEFIVPPFDPEVETAAQQADAARTHLEDRLKQLHATPAPRAANCGMGSTLHLRRHGEGGRVDDCVIRTSCGRSDCPFCWRRRIAKAGRRACAVLLDAPGPGHMPRLGAVYFAEVAWERWKAFDKAVRRHYRQEHPDRGDNRGRCSVGRLRVRQNNNVVVVIAENPFPGSQPVTPAEALAVVSAAILDHLHTAKHSFRLLGDWSEEQSTEWELIEKHKECISFDQVMQELEQMGLRPRFVKNPDYRGVFWRTGSDLEAMTVAASLQFLGCPSFAKERNGCSHWANSDSGGGDNPDDFGPV